MFVLVKVVLRIVFDPLAACSTRKPVALDVNCVFVLNSDCPILDGKTSHNSIRYFVGWGFSLSEEEQLPLNRQPSLLLERSCKGTDMTTSHKHAEAMLAYARDAAETSTPWERWDYHNGSVWLPLGDHPKWHHDFEYRRKPASIERFIPVLRMGAGTLVLTEAKTDRKYAVDDQYNGRGPSEKQAGVLHVKIHPETLELVSATLEKL